MPLRPRIPVRLLDAGLRLTVKRRLAIETDARNMRRRLERTAKALFRTPKGTETEPVALTALGREVPALWADAPGTSRARVVLYFHGGAYLAGSPATHKHLAAHLGQAAGAAALLVDYRLAPEHPFPAAIQDALSAYAALLGLGQRPETIALAGDSAGGGLAAALLVAAAEAGLPQPAALVAFSPWADLTAHAESLGRNARADAMLPGHRMPDVAEMILQGADARNPLASPVFARFESPPPAIVFTSTTEIVHDDALALVERLREAGGDARLETRPRLPHAWPAFVGLLRAADRTVAEAGAFLRERLAAV